ncbi:MAG TPA: AMP-binding protein [Candidatus Cloacimonadota bacterium]|nr:AMP-binding protein [Candidatus Cloacimonadota bacterium]HPM02713.1 AMP-binding protein [Candidatus Cloacimonadota bacterium]
MLLHHQFIEVAKKYPQKTAIYEQMSGKEVNFEKLLIASLLMAEKVKKYQGKFIGIMLPPSAGCTIAVLAVLFAGKTPVMINYSTGATQNCLYAQKKCNFRTILTSEKLLEKIQEEPVKGMVFLEEVMKKINILEKLKAAMVAKFPASVLKTLVSGGKEDDDLVILFTSGSEKDPKAVMLSHKNILSNINGILSVLNVSHEDVFVANLPYFHVFGLTINLWIPLFLGCKVVAHANPLDYKTIVDSIRKHKVSIMVATPTFYYWYLKKSQTGDFDSVKYAISGADKLHPQIQEEYLKIHNLKVLEGYGTTETSPVISTNTPDSNRENSIGRPIPGIRVKIVKLDTDDECLPGEEGKILVKGHSIMKGYYGDLEETSLRIRNGWYDTGDVGMLDNDGFLYHKGRLKRFVKIAGEMISLTKVESVLDMVLPDGTICCVVEIPDPVKGAEIVAAVTTTEIDQKKIKKLLAKHLPSLAIPKRFHVLENIPMAPSGKVNFRAVEEICRKLEEENE